MNKLTETIPMLLSNDYKERVRAEYFELNIRIAGLKQMLEKWNNGTLSFIPAAPKDIYENQLNNMISYLKILEHRMTLESIDTEEPEPVKVEDVEGNTKYLQGLGEMPIMVNTIWKGTEATPSDVCEMHIGSVKGKNVLLITPEHISVEPSDEEITINERFTEGMPVIYEGDDESDYIHCPYCKSIAATNDKESDLKPRHCPDCGTKLIY